MHEPRTQNGALHGVIFLAALAAITLGLAPLDWPWHFLLPLIAYASVVMACPPLRRSGPRLSSGRIRGLPLVVAAALGAATCGALILFDRLAHPDVAGLAQGIPVAAFGHLLLAGICFSVINAAMEEIIFRGLLWEFVAAEWNQWVALVTTTLLFGWGHLHGYPPGPLGAVLAGLFGFALGLLRWWTDGLALAIAVHVCADGTIFGLLWSSGALSRGTG